MPTSEKLRERVLELTFERDNALLHVRLNQLLQKGLDAILSSDSLDEIFDKFFGIVAEGVRFDSAILLRLDGQSFTTAATSQAPGWPEQGVLPDEFLNQLPSLHAMAVFNLRFLP